MSIFFSPKQKPLQGRFLCLTAAFPYTLYTSFIGFSFTPGPMVGAIVTLLRY